MQKGKLGAALIFTLAFLLGTAGMCLAQFAGGGPKPGDVYKEYYFSHGTGNWRVTDPQMQHCTRYPEARAFLPNPTLAIHVDDLQGATRAELVMDFWSGHDGTRDKRFRVNNNAWIPIPELHALTSSNPSPGNRYFHQTNHIIPIPLNQLRTGTNYIQGYSGPNHWNPPWGQWGWYGFVLRVYYNTSKPIARGQISSPGSNSLFGENPTISASISSGTADRVDFLAHYDGYDTDGDGIYRDWHRNYQRSSWNDPMGIKGHVGTATSAPFRVTWDTKWIPDQDPGQVKLIARIRSSSGYWFVTNEVTNLSFQRSNSSVKLYKPYGVPPNFWVRIGQVKSSRVNIPSLAGATEAVMLVRTWNGNERNSNFFNRVNSWTAPKYGLDHFYSFDRISVPLSALRTGENTISFGSSTTHHGIEVMWPGPAIAVRYGSAPSVTAPSITQQPADRTVTQGQTATFSVSATGTAPLNYQWRKNGVNIAGANSASYTTPATSSSDNGAAFSVVVSNTAGSVTSRNAILTVGSSSPPSSPEPPPSDSSNVISNPGFESGTTGWTYFTNGQGSFTTTSPGHGGSSQAAQVAVTTAGSNNQLFQQGISLEPNTQYTLSFAAYSNTGRNMSVTLQKHGSPFTNYGLSQQAVNLGTGWSVHSFTFTTRNFSSPVNDARLMFWFGSTAVAGDRFFIDNVVLSKGEGAAPPQEPPPSSPEPPPSDSSNVISNPGFESGTAGWTYFTNGQGTFTASNPAYAGSYSGQVAVMAAGSNNQLFQQGISLEPNTQYTLSFAAYSNTGRNMSVSLQQHGSPFTNYGLSQQAVNLGTGWSVHSFTFNTRNFSSPVNDARLMFWFANTAVAGDRFFIDNVVLSKGDAPPPSSPEPPPSDSANVINNPGFESGTANWTYFTNGQGSFTTTSPGHGGSSQAAQVAVTTAGSNNQLFQQGISLEPNTQYTLSFAAYSNTGRNMSVTLQKHGSPFTNYGLSQQAVNLGTGWSVHSFTFTTRNFSSPVNDARLMFWFANTAVAGDRFFIDNVVLTRN